EAAGLLRHSLPRRAVLRLRLADGLPRVRADAAQLRQVLTNLVRNAAEALGEQDGVGEIATGVVDADRPYLARTQPAPDLPAGKYVYLEVADTGGGMTDAVRARIFDPFFTTKFTGRGLGLSAVLGIVRSHGGTLWVDTAPGRGSTFRVLLPPAGATVAA